MQTSKNARTILVGEDEMEVRGYLEMALKCLGYSVELAQDGDEVPGPPDEVLVGRTVLAGN